MSEKVTGTKLLIAYSYLCILSENLKMGEKVTITKFKIANSHRWAKSIVLKFNAAPLIARV